MPKSRLRKKSDYTPPPPGGTAAVNLDAGRGWVAPLMLTMFLVGLAWIVVYYVTSAAWPIGSWGNWNILVGFGFIAAGFGVSTQWK
ncbi:cell division protein CrgA [Streptomyces sp. NPDC092296]|uniref:cell division protein CrgA n=1 Tax=Streptomyces sp. NPDC092296 TaxID=3366012 RepID=UPI003801516D